MLSSRLVGRLTVACVALQLTSSIALAQQTGIAGVVRDTTGAVVPGVTVEAESPALIEKMRSVITDAQGLYSIADLRPGPYSVTFSLAGFRTIKREGIQLSGSSVATVNAELAVGAVEETLTVTGEAPSVDTRNVVQRTVLADAVREALPTGRNVLFMATLIPGTSRSFSTGSSRDLANTTEGRGGSMIHGSRVGDYRLLYDGTPTDLAGTGFNQSWQNDPGEVQEFVYQLGAHAAENPFGGITANIIPKEGGNRTSGRGFYAFTNKNLQTSNLTQALRDVGLRDPASIQKHWDANFSMGGPIVRDRLWWFASYRNQGQDDQIPGMYAAIDPLSFVFDPARGAAGNVDVNRPAIYYVRNYYYSSRLTWQASPKNKFAVYWGPQTRHNFNRQVSGNIALEAGNNQQNGDHPFTNGGCGGQGCGYLGLTQVSWKSPRTSRLLLEVTYGSSPMDGGLFPYWGDLAHQYPGPNVVGVVDTGTGYTYRANVNENYVHLYDHDSLNGSVSYVTGAHSVKFGVQTDWGGQWLMGAFHNNHNMTFRFQNGVPNQITIFNEPNDRSNGHFRRQGFYAQDQWTFRRLTVNGGVRFDFNQGRIPEGQTSGPNGYAPLTRWPAVKNVPNWKDISPRVGLAYDLFGDGKTALKYSLSRYVVNNSTQFPAAMNPISYNRTATRPWNDRTPVPGGIPNDYFPQEAELGTLSNSAFGTAAATTTVDDAIREGWGVRQYNWETQVGVQHQLLPQLSLNFSFTRRDYHNFTVTDNRALVPADYDEFCVIAPPDSRLGAVSGTRICGLYDLDPAKRTVRPDNFQTDANRFGTQKETYQGIDLTVNARLASRVTVQGGLNSGTEGNIRDACFVIDSPEAMRFCKISPPWRTNVRFLSSIQLPWGINTGLTFIADPNFQILANYTVTNASITSGDVQFLKPTRTTFGGGNATVSLIEPETRYSDVIYQVDLRVGKNFRYRGTTIRLNVDIANLLNVSTVLEFSNAYGANWLRPSAVMNGRLIKPGITVEW